MTTAKTNPSPNVPKQNWNGWLVLDKPLGMSSAQAVGAVKRLLRPKKIGHGGTLDPLASGILPLALGEATKAFQYVAANEKAYHFTVRWGESRTTDDAEGDVVERSDARPTQEQIEAALPDFIGEIMQAPPDFSAIKVAGQRAYAKARAGEAVALPPRPVMVHSLILLNCPDGDHAEFEMRCGKGTYVRSIARDLGRSLGCFGYVSALRRTEVGKFDEACAISLEKLEELVHSAALNEQLLPISSVLDDIPAVELDASAAHRLTCGNPVMLPPASFTAFDAEPVTVQVLSRGQFLAIGEAFGGEVRPVRVFHV